MRESHLTGTSTSTKRFPARRIAAAVPLLAAAATWAQTAGMELQGNAPPQPPSRAASSALPVLPPAPKGGAEAGGGAGSSTYSLPPDGRVTAWPTQDNPLLPPARYRAEIESVPVGGQPAVPIVVERAAYSAGLATGTAYQATPVP